MRKAITRLALFLCLLLVLDRLVYAGAVFLRDNTGRLQELDLLFEDGGWDPPIVFFGDSRTRRNFDMRAIEDLTGLDAYDFGRDGASAEENLFMLEEYFRHDHHPRVVVFEADPPFLQAGYGQFFKEEFRTHLAVIPDTAELLTDVRPTLQQRASDLAVTWLIESASLPNRLPELWNRWRDRPKEEEKRGVQFYPCGPEEMHLTCRYYNGAENFVIGHGAPRTWVPFPFRIDTERMSLFEHLAALAERMNFRLLLLETPRLDGDRAYPPKPKARSEAFYCELARSHPSVLYARVTHVDGIGSDPLLYWDWSHFNAAGATKMSQLIAPLIAALANGSRQEPCVLQ